MGIEQIGLLGAVIVLAQAVFKLVEAKVPLFSNGKNGKNNALCQTIDRLEKTIGNHHTAEMAMLEKIGDVLQKQVEHTIAHNTEATARGASTVATLQRIEGRIK